MKKYSGLYISGVSEPDPQESKANLKAKRITVNSIGTRRSKKRKVTWLDAGLIPEEEGIFTSGKSNLLNYWFLFWILLYSHVPRYMLFILFSYYFEREHSNLPRMFLENPEKFIFAPSTFKKHLVFWNSLILNYIWTYRI